VLDGMWKEKRKKEEKLKIGDLFDYVKKRPIMYIMLMPLCAKKWFSSRLESN
jgi:hypothetical protein